MTRRDWLLLLLGAPPTEDEGAIPAVDRVRAMKCLFILGERQVEVKSGEFYVFQPYNYGPFDASVYRDAESLMADGLAEEVTIGGIRAYRVTAEGAERARALAAENPRGAELLVRARRWANGLRFSDLLRAIYREWPHMRARSVFIES